MGIVVSIALLAGALAYIFWPEENPFTQRAKTRLDFLRERRDVVMENLRDLNFEYKAGKYPEQDYSAQQSMLEQEAAVLLSEIDILERT